MPYNVSIVATNAAGVSAEECIVTDFAKQSSECCVVDMLDVCSSDLVTPSPSPPPQRLPMYQGWW